MDILLFSVDVLTVMLDKRWLKGSCYLQVFIHMQSSSFVIIVLKFVENIWLVV